MKPCPYCGEQIQDSAIKCRFCGEWLEKPPSKRQPQPQSEQVMCTGCGKMIGGAVKYVDRLPFCESCIEQSKKRGKPYRELRKEHQSSTEENAASIISVFLVIAVIAAGIWICSKYGTDEDIKVTQKSERLKSSRPTVPKTVPKTQEEIRKEKIEKLFSAWDGSHRGLTKLIKKSMNDPDSYKHVETVYWDKGDHLVVKTTFRGKNALGGVVKNWIMAKVDLNGNVIEVISQGP